ncbi:DUF6011 domain-containing protein [Nocardia farcinica]|uniref:DUF6011 domain-containing protein n=1 Tax=Nocardia farcinica TaxID=37329 RepID=UPI0018950152|nr:DUF6011 domain-containing protein [Nocardia farcinica]MBF6522857.1 hypothetical protein [Nocardia farcinica]
MAATDGPTVRLVAHCRRCHGWLLSPESVAQGIGPTCAIRERAEQRAAEAAAATSMLTLFELPAGNSDGDGPHDLLELLGLAS